MPDQDFNINIRTIADTAGIKLTDAELQKLQQTVNKLATQQAAAVERAAAEAGRALRVVAGGALIAGGYQFVSQLRDASKEIEKISTELDKQGDLVVRNAQRFSEMAKFATTNADVIKIGEGALKGVESAHKRLLDAAGQELTIWQKIADVWAAGFKDEGPIAQAKRLAEEQADQNYQMERQNAIREISEALRTKEALAARTYAQQIEYLNQKIAEQEAIQKRVGVANIEDYLKAGTAAENYRKILEGVTESEKKRTAEAKKQLDSSIGGASAQTKAVLMNEQAAQKARAEGREKDADLYQKSVEQFEKSMTQAQRAELENIRKQQRSVAPPPPPRQPTFRDLAPPGYDFNAATGQYVPKPGYVPPPGARIPPQPLPPPGKGGPVTADTGKDVELLARISDAVMSLGVKFDRAWG